jgi:hypothetical protein
MRNTPYSRLSLVAAVLATVAIGLVGVRSGGAMFSPGALRGADATPVTLGGVTSHAALANDCGSCHTPPWSGTRMNTRCLECHTEIRQDIADSKRLHGALSDARSCVSCHGEHAGRDGKAFNLSGFGDAHSQLGFPLTGAHERTPCTSCHKPVDGRTVYDKAPKTCIGCHERDDKHNGGFGTDCASCHTTSRWEGAQFAHEVFPLDHGGEGRIACKTCHEDPKDYKQYTCYNCHEHSRARVQAQHREEVGGRNLDRCLECHRGGRGEGGEGGERGRRRRERD